jgi:hypothetical protein
VMDAYQDEAIQRWHVQRAESLAEAREWVAGWQGGWAAESGAHWAVVEAGSDLLLGRAPQCMAPGRRSARRARACPSAVVRRST